MSDKRVCTLMYHDVYDVSNKESGFNIDSNYPYKIKKEAFEEQIKALSKYVESRGVDKGYIRLSFDDGGVSFFNIIMPILEKYGFKGYFFIATSFIGQDGFLTEEMIKEMHFRGHVIGGHSHTHRQRMHTLPLEDLENDWKECIDTLNRITGDYTRIVSLPNGFESKRIFKTLCLLGIKDVYTSEPFEKPKHHDNLNVFGRYGIRNTMTIDDVLAIAFNNKTKNKIRYKKAVLNFLKKIMGNSYITIRERIFEAKHSKI